MANEKYIKKEDFVKGNLDQVLKFIYFIDPQQFVSAFEKAGIAIANLEDIDRIVDLVNKEGGKKEVVLPNGAKTTFDLLAILKTIDIDTRKVKTANIKFI